MQTPVERARLAVAAILAAYSDANTSNEREAIARLIACLMPQGCRGIAEMAAEALQEGRVA
jgi:hypothetical protein